MNSDDKIRMAREAGILPNANLLDVLKFANLVAAAEREECAKLCETTKLRMNQDECAVKIRARTREWQWSSPIDDKQAEPFDPFGKPTLTDDEEAFAKAMTVLIKAGYGKEALALIKAKV